MTLPRKYVILHRLSDYKELTVKAKRILRGIIMRGKKGFTLVELLVVISIIALLLSILLPALNKAKEQAKLAVCLSNMKQLGYIFKMYIEDNEYRFPFNDDPSTTHDPYYFEWGDGEFAYGGARQTVSTFLADMPLPEDRMLYPYAKDFDLFFCPADNGENLGLTMGYWKPTTFYAVGSSYRYNYYNWENPTIKPMANASDGFVASGIANKKENWVPHPSRYILLHEPPALQWTWFGGRWFLWHFARGETTVTDPGLARSPFISNILFVDGHAGTFDFTDTLVDPITGQENPFICEPTADWIWYKPGL